MPLVFENQKSNTSIQNPKLEIKNRPSDQNQRLATSVQNAKSATSPNAKSATNVQNPAL